MPTAMNPCGAERQITSSTSGIDAISPRLSGAATGVATTMRRAPLACATRQATRIVAPVAMPSSTMTAVRSREVDRARVAAEPGDSRLELVTFAPLDRGELARLEPNVGDDVVVQHARALLADRAHRELGLPGHAELAHDEHVERSTERDRDRRGDRDAAAGEPEHDRIGRVDVDQTGGESPACVSPVGEVLHEMTGRRVRGVRQFHARTLPIRWPPSESRAEWRGR